MFEVSATEVRAIVVGIDHYDYGDQWTLNGPAADALRTVDWLLAHNIAKEHIALFLTLQSWSDPQVKSWVQRTGWHCQREASQYAIANYINNELKGQGGRAILVHWGGHGCVDRKKPLNYLFTADAKSGVPSCLCVQEILSTLADSEFAHLMQQVLIFDACAAPFTPAHDLVNPNPARLIDSDTANTAVQQCTMYAATRGQLAANMSRRGTGLFTEQLFVKLKQYPEPSFEQFTQAFDDIQREQAANGLGAQHPRMDFSFPGPYTGMGRWYRTTDLAFKLLDLIDALEIPAALVRRAYLRSLPDITRQRKEKLTLDMLQDLKNMSARHNDYPIPLIEFALRLGTEAEKPALRKIAKASAQSAQYRALETTLKYEKKAKVPLATLFIQIASASAAQFTWWLDAPDPDRCTGKKSVPLGSGEVKEAFAERASDVVPEAAALCAGKYQMRVGLIVPAELFSAELELVTIRDSTGDSYVLNQEYPVVFHWYDRMVGTNARALDKFRLIMGTIGSRIGRAKAVTVAWLDAADSDTDVQRYARALHQLSVGAANAIFLGVEHPCNATPAANLSTIVGCLKEGVPCLFWLQQPATPEAAQQVRERACQRFEEFHPSDGPVAVWQHRKLTPQKEQMAPVTVIWDAPAAWPKNVTTETTMEDHQ